MNEKIGYWAFIIGVVLALIVGIFAPMIGAMNIDISWLPLVLLVLGLIVGILNIGDKEINNFLIAVIAIAVVAGLANLSTIPLFGSALQSIVGYLAIFVAPAALVVALKSIYNLGSTPKVM